MTPKDNVELWLNNDATLYGLMINAIESTDNVDDAADQLVKALPEATPDGEKFSFEFVRSTMLEYWNDYQSEWL